MKNIRIVPFIVLLFVSYGLQCRALDDGRVSFIVNEAKKDYYSGRYLNALEEFITGMKVACNEKDSLSIMVCMGYIGNIYNCFNDNSSSLSYLLSGYDMALLCRNTDMAGHFLSNIVGTYCRLGNVAKAEEYYALEKDAVERDSVNHGYYLRYNRARILQAQNRLGEALAMHFKTLDYAAVNRMDSVDRLVQMSEIGNVLVKLARYGEALAYGGECVSLSRRLGDSDLLINALHILSDANGGLGRSGEAAAYRAEALSLADSVFNAKRFYVVRNRLDVYKDSLTGERITGLSGVITRQSGVMAVLAVLLFLAVSALFGVWYAYHKLRRARKLLVQRDIDGEKCGLPVSPRPLLPAAQPAAAGEGGGPGCAGPDGSVPPLVLDDGQVRLLLGKITRMFDDVAVITDPDFSLVSLARRVGSNTRYVSWVINNSYGKNFKTLLNECRVREACRRLRDDEHYGNITIQGIYESLGYRNASSFNRAFRQVMGMPPSVYQKLAAD